MKTETGIRSIHRRKDDRDFETGGIWEDAGFRPPQFYMQIIEFLHFKCLNEEQIPESYLEMIFEIVSSQSKNCSYEINDRKKMLSFAECLGIDVSKGDENSIAAMIILNIISDYFLPAGISSATERMIFNE